jgi:hypothetical protein
LAEFPSLLLHFFFTEIVNNGTIWEHSKHAGYFCAMVLANITPKKKRVQKVNLPVADPLVALWAHSIF